MKVFKKLCSWLFEDKYPDYIETCIERYSNSLQENPYYAVYYKLSPKGGWRILTQNWLPKTWGIWDFDRLSDPNFPVLEKKDQALYIAKNLTRKSLKEMLEAKELQWSAYLAAREDFIAKQEQTTPKFIKVK